MTTTELSNYVVNIHSLPNTNMTTTRGRNTMLRTLELFLEQSGSFLDTTVKHSILYVLQNQRNLYNNKQECQQLIQALNRSLNQTNSHDMYLLKQNLIKLLKFSVNKV